MEGKISMCILDFNQDDLKLIKDKEFDVFEGSAGTRVEVTYSGNSSSKYCLLNYSFPLNLHEYEVLIINLINQETIPYNFEDHQRKKISTSGETKLAVSYPTNIFDPRPLSFHVLNKQIKEFSKKQSLLIVFADSFYEVIYQPVHIRSGGYPKDLEEVKYSNYSFLESISLRTPKSGVKSNILVKGGELKKLFEDFKELEYHQTFYIETIWSEDNKRIHDPNYIPLLENSSKEVISYAYSYENMVLFVFPDFKKKGEFTSRFLTQVAPQILPDLFSYSSKFDWLNSSDYWVPEHENLIQERKLETERHKIKILEIDKSISENRKNYKFLHDLISETDDTLVDAVVEFLKWIGFQKIIKVDDSKEEGNLEEDIQIQIGEKLLVIEVKGIGGTSKDSECNQISKVRLRRMKERKSTEVYGLYIVNHERYKPPKKRTNPPFNDTQIQDAINDDRGLLTTWDLFKLYFDIEDGIFSKEEAKEKFLQFGLVDFRSGLQIVGKIDKLYKQGFIASLEINGVEINDNETVFLEKNGILTKYKILSIQQNKASVKSAKEGRIGIAFDKKVSNNSILYKKSNEAAANNA